MPRPRTDKLFTVSLSVREHGQNPPTPLCLTFGGFSSSAAAVTESSTERYFSNFCFQIRPKTRRSESLHAWPMADTSISLTGQILISVALAAGLSINAFVLLAMA